MSLLKPAVDGPGRRRAVTQRRHERRRPRRRRRKRATALQCDCLRRANCTLRLCDPQGMTSTTVQSLRTRRTPCRRRRSQSCCSRLPDERRYRACSGHQTWTGDAKNASSAHAVDVRSRAAVAARVRLAGRSAHDASTRARKTSGATMSAVLSPTAARETAAAVRSKKKPA